MQATQKITTPLYEYVHYKKVSISVNFVHKIPPKRMRNVRKAAINN